MKRRLKKFRKGLEKENRELFDKIIININSYSLNTYQANEIYEELLGMFVESENRNEYLSLVIGSDVNEFCKELTKNAKRKTFLEKIINFLYYTSLSISTIIIFFLVLSMIIGYEPSAYIKEENLYISINSIVNITAIMIVIGIFQRINSRNIFNKKIKSIVFIIYIVIFASISMITRELLDGNKFIAINTIASFITITIITVGLWFLDKYVSKKSYYN